MRGIVTSSPGTDYIAKYTLGGWDGEYPPFTSFAAEHKLTGYLKDRISQGHVEDTDGGEFGGPLSGGSSERRFGDSQPVG